MTCTIVGPLWGLTYNGGTPSLCAHLCMHYSLRIVRNASLVQNISPQCQCGRAYANTHRNRKLEIVVDGPAYNMDGSISAPVLPGGVHVSNTSLYWHRDGASHVPNQSYLV